MIDKKLIRQAAEDIDIFEADLSQEYDRIARPRKLLRLWPWAAAACMVIAVGISLPMLMGTGNGNKNTIAEAKTPIEGGPVAQASRAESNVTMPVSPPLKSAKPRIYVCHKRKRCQFLRQHRQRLNQKQIKSAQKLTKWK